MASSSSEKELQYYSVNSEMAILLVELLVAQYAAQLSTKLPEHRVSAEKQQKQEQ